MKLRRFIKSIFKREVSYVYSKFESKEITDDIYSIPLGSVVELRSGEMAIIDDFSVDYRSGFRQCGIKLYHKDHMQYLITFTTREAIVHIPIGVVPVGSKNFSLYWMHNKKKAVEELKKHFPNIKT